LRTKLRAESGADERESDPAPQPCNTQKRKMVGAEAGLRHDNTDYRLFSPLFQGSMHVSRVA
jgi:hypothetical protein